MICNKCYLIDNSGSSKDYLYKDIRIHLCHECWYSTPSRCIPKLIEELANASIERNTIGEGSERYIVPPDPKSRFKIWLESLELI